TLYLVRGARSQSKDVLGWMKKKDVSKHTHQGVTKRPGAMKIKGTGKATSKAGGGHKDTVHKPMKKHQGKTLHVNLTEKVGKNTWYRGKIDVKGSNIWIHESSRE